MDVLFSLGNHDIFDFPMPSVHPPPQPKKCKQRFSLLTSVQTRTEPGKFMYFFSVHAL